MESVAIWPKGTSPWAQIPVRGSDVDITVMLPKDTCPALLRGHTSTFALFHWQGLHLLEEKQCSAKVKAKE